jgi:hypothetical protein
MPSALFEFAVLLVTVFELDPASKYIPLPVFEFAITWSMVELDTAEKYKPVLKPVKVMFFMVIPLNPAESSMPV